MNEKIKNILKIAILWYVIAFVLLIVNKGLNLEMALWCLVSPIAILVAFAPSILLLWFLCKKINSKILKCLLIAFVIPFTNMVYCFIEALVSKGNLSIISGILGLCSLFALPIAFVGTLFTPAKWIKFKKEFLITEVLMFVLGIAMMFATINIIGYVSDKYTEHQLKEYDNVIEYIESYKNKNGVYPKNIDNIEINPSIFHLYEYKAMENYKGFVLKVAENEYSTTYRYCSSDKYDGCKEGSFKGKRYEKIGKWISEYIDD